MECRAIANLPIERLPGIQTDSQSEPVAKPDGRLRPVGNAVGSQRWGKVEGRTVVNQSPILGANEDPFGDVEVGAPAVDECSSSLCGCPWRRRRSERHAGAAC